MKLNAISKEATINNEDRSKDFLKIYEPGFQMNVRNGVLLAPFSLLSLKNLTAVRNQEIMEARAAVYLGNLIKKK